MDQDKLRKDIEAIVASIFSEKEEADMRKKAEGALQKAATTIEDLTNALEERSGEMENLESKVSEHEEKASDLKTELEAAQQEVETVNTKLVEAENALEEIKKDRVADVRMAKLEEAGIARSEEEDRAVQVAKVREMSDEEYAAYRDELTAVRQAVLDEIAAASEKEEKEEKNEVEEKEEAEEKEETEEKEEAEEETDPANIDPNQAVSAALNMDVPSESILSKYADLGKAMAENLTK